MNTAMRTIMDIPIAMITPIPIPIPTTITTPGQATIITAKARRA